MRNILRGQMESPLQLQFLVPLTGEGSSAEVQQMKEQSKNMLIKMHTELVKMATKSGISDLCALDKGERVENVLAGHHQPEPQVQILLQNPFFSYSSEESHQRTTPPQDCTLLWQMQQVLL